MGKEFKLLLMIFLVLAAGYLSNKIIITGKFHILEEKTDTELIVLSDPSGAEVYLGKNYVGTTPATLTQLSPGDYQVTLKKLGYYDITQSVIVNKDQRKDVFIKLEPNTGRAFIESVPSGADIFIDGVHGGVTPKLVSGLTDGTHVIKITKLGYKDKNDFITVNKDKEVRVFFSLEKQEKERFRESLYAEKS